MDNLPRRLACLFLIALLFALNGCATRPAGSGKSITAYDIRLLALVTPERPEMSRQLAQRLVKIEAAVERAAEIRVDRFLLLDSYEVNASATVVDGKRLLLINRGILRLLEKDESALAALFGHEIAHLKLEHLSARQGVSRAIGVGAQTLGFAASLFIPGAGQLINAGGSALTQAYSRDQEREADRQGLLYAVSAGYAPGGMLCMLDALPVARGSDGRSGFFDSHPGKLERIAGMRALIQEKYGEALPAAAGCPKPEATYQ